ncbi:MAG: putative photosynthetic complex assembly protein PuhE [Pseudomonadota bacterium]
MAKTRKACGLLETPWIAAIVALFLWWFSTGAILFVVRRADGDGPDGHIWASLLSMPVLFAGVVGLNMSLETAAVGGSYIGFIAALVIWGWIELTFLSGFVTGPNRGLCPPDAAGLPRFLRALGTVLWHEALLLVALVSIWAISRGNENQIAFLTFSVLFLARVSAKLNLFLGVPHINTEFLPRPLAHLPSYFRIRRLNWLFPASVTALTFATVFWLQRLSATGDVGFALLAAITALATLEHWLMVLPLPDAKLWRWMLPAPKDKPVRITTDGL